MKKNNRNILFMQINIIRETEKKYSTPCEDTRGRRWRFYFGLKLISDCCGPSVYPSQLFRRPAGDDERLLVRGRIVVGTVLIKLAKKWKCPAVGGGRGRWTGPRRRFVMVRWRATRFSHFLSPHTLLSATLHRVPQK